MLFLGGGSGENTLPLRAMPHILAILVTVGSRTIGFSPIYVMVLYFHGTDLVLSNENGAGTWKKIESNRDTGI